MAEGVRVCAPKKNEADTENKQITLYIAGNNVAPRGRR